MISIPKSKKGVPQYKSRGEVYLTIYHNPSDQNIGVIYITTGYTYKKNSIVKVKIDNNKEHDFNVLEGDTAFTDDENVLSSISEWNRSVKAMGIDYTFDLFNNFSI